MREACFHIFDTPIGPCGIAWGADGLLAVRLPTTDGGDLADRLRKAVPGAHPIAPTGEAAATTAGICALLSGDKRDLLEIRLDLSATGPFDQAVYAVARAIPPGRTLTYGEVARRLPPAARCRPASCRGPWASHWAATPGPLSCPVTG